MPNIKYNISLRKNIRDKLQELADDPDTPERTALRVNIILDSDTGTHGEPIPVEDIMDKYQTNKMTINRARKAFVEKGIEGLIERKEYTGDSVVDEETELRIIRIIEDESPTNGDFRWSLREIADRAREKGYIKDISPTKLMQIFRKHGYGYYFQWFLRNSLSNDEEELL